MPFIEQEEMWRVVASFIAEDGGFNFGPFTDRALAETCVCALAGRDDVTSAMVVEERK